MATLLRRVTDVMCMLKAWHSIKRLRKLVSRPVSRNIISMKKINGPEISATLRRPWHQPPTWYSATPPHLWMRSSTLSVLSTWPWNPLETSPTTLQKTKETNRNELTGWLHLQPNPKGPRVIRSCSPPYQVPEEYLHKEVPGSFKSPCRNWSMPSGIAVQQTWQINGHGHSFEEGSQIWVNFASGQIPGLVVINDIDQATTITLALTIKLESMKFPPS